ncbi:alpha/beta hydrolase [Nocardia sp. IFM 10818]
MLVCHGIPGSHREAEAFDKAAVAAGMRIIAVDRPGMGESPIADGPRRVGDWVDSAVAIADLLGVARFGVIGVSGGGPYALACAARAAGRVTAVAVVSSPAPFAGGGAGLDAMARRRRRGVAFVRRFPILMRPMAARMRAVVSKPSGVARLVDQMASADRRRVGRDAELAEKLQANIGEAFRQGSRGFAEDMLAVFCRPWGFELADIKVPVAVFHGAEDANVPLADGRRLADLIPGSRLHVVEHAGHLLFVDHPAAILESLRDAGDSRL